MKVLRGLSEVPLAPGGRVLALGTFDGVHLGHRRVIENALESGRTSGLPASVVTFDPHPLRVLQPDDPPPLLTPMDVKADLIEALGADELVVVPFTAQLSRIDAGEFCEDVLVGALQARHVSVGANFRFGHEARGDATFLQGRSEFETAAVPLVELGGAPVSSSRIRDLVARGEVARAAELLGAPFQLEGLVVEGEGRGQSLGVPTANLRLQEEVAVPAFGIYAALAADPEASAAERGGRTPLLGAAVSVGVRPTFESDGRLVVEAHLIDFAGDLYGRTLRLTFLERLRDELRFESADDLARQMSRDLEQARKIAGSAQATL